MSIQQAGRLMGWLLAQGTEQLACWGATRTPTQLSGKRHREPQSPAPTSLLPLTQPCVPQASHLLALSAP